MTRLRKLPINQRPTQCKLNSRQLAGHLGIAALLAIALIKAASASTAQAGTAHPWLEHAPAGQTLAERIAPPEGFERLPASPHSFALWLRNLPMKPVGTKVMLHDGRPKWYQGAHFAVLDIDTGKRDLQQCADAVMRLRAEYLLAAGRAREIAFNDTGGAKPISYAKWSNSHRPRLKGQRLSWSRRARPDASYRSFRHYMNVVFAYAGTYSLSKELRPVATEDMVIGDVFIKGGFPGHAVLVSDMVRHPETGEKRFLLIQSYMPAQDMHVLKNPSDPFGGPWYALPLGGELDTPEWRFKADSLMRWR